MGQVKSLPQNFGGNYLKRSRNNKSSIIIFKYIITAIIIAAVILLVCLIIGMKDFIVEKIKEKIPPGFPAFSIEMMLSEKVTEDCRGIEEHCFILQDVSMEK